MKKKIRREGDIERTFLRKMKAVMPEIRILKLSAIGSRAWPDRLILLSRGKTIFIEFKRPGEVPTPLQEDVHDYLRKNGHDVQVFDDDEKAFQYCWKFRKDIA